MKVDMNQPVRFFFVIVIMLIASDNSFADNGRLALARPVSGITVDGDFADWPTSLPWYSIEQILSGDIPQDASDFDASFRVGYDEDALYVALQVRDDSIVLDGKSNRWRSQDGCSIYLDVGHTGEQSAPVEYNFFGKSSLRSKSGLAVAWSCQRSETQHRYEWRFDLKRIRRPQVKLVPGLVVGLGVIVHERDQDDRLNLGSRFSWGPGVRKDRSSERLGDILFVSSEVETGNLQGRLIAAADALPLKFRTLKLQHQGQSSPVTIISDGRGEFEVALPAGQYRVFTMTGEAIRRISVEAGATTARLDFRVAPEIAKPTEAAQKTLVSVGHGNRTGRLHRFGTGDGLPGGAMWGLTQSGDGTLWIASENAGLLRFDGKSIASFDSPTGLPQLSCKSVAADHSGNMWVTANQGDERGKLFRFDGEAFIRVAQKPGPNLLIYQVITDKDGRHWVRDEFRISRYDEGVFTTIYDRTPRHKLHSMAIESASRVWVGTSHGLVRLDAVDDAESKGLWRETRFDTADTLPGGGRVSVRALLIDSSKRLWIGTDRGLRLYDGDSFKSWSDGLGEVPVVALAKSEDGAIWVGTDIGLVEFSDGEFDHIADTGHINDLYVDREQNVWIAGQGLVRYERQPMSPQKRSELESLEARKLLQTRDGALWVGTKQDVVQCKFKLAKHFATSDGLVGKPVTSLFEDSQGGVWIGTHRGVSRFDGQRFASRTSGIGAPSVNAFAEDSTGRIWMGMRNGVTIYDPQRQPGADAQDTETTDADTDAHTATLTGQFSFLTTMDGLQSNQVNGLLADADGSVWVGTEFGVCRWRENEVEQFDAPNKVVCFLQDNSNDVWAGSDGLYRFDGMRWTKIDIGGNARVNGLADDPAGRIWMATNVGLKVYDGVAVQTLTSSDGALDWCSDVIWDHRENSVLVSGNQVVTYEPRVTPPPITITRVTAEKEHESTAEVRIGSTQPSLRFAFHGTSFKTRPDAMLYRYRLRGFENEWTLTGNTQASYGRLPPGQYTFEVAAIDRDLNYSDDPASVHVYVDREYVQMALWSSLGCALIAVGFLSITVVRRNRGIRRLNAELEQRVKDRTAMLEWEMAENEKLHKQLLQSQKLDAVGTMASGIAHDVNNSLAVIKGFAEIAKTTSSGSSEFIDHILTACGQAAGTTRGLLTFSQQSSGEKMPHDLVQLVQETSNFLRQILPASIKLSCDFPENATIWCSLDEVHIQQVLVNVTLNARDALPAGGEISISVGEHPTRPGFAQVVIADNGKGMPQEVRECIFDPFFTTKSRGQGTGLGMAIVHGIIEDHEGTIDIDSSAGQGTTVSVALPCCPPAASESSHDDTSEPVLAGRGETILVAEDNREVQTMMVTQLKSAGFGVLTADDGQQVLDVLREHERHVRLVILDIDLPEKDGLECLREIGLQFPHVPTIMMSGLSSIDPTQVAAPFLRKPFDRSQLLSTINIALREGRSEQASGVLVVDDDELVRMSTKAALDSCHFDVYLAANGTEAVSQLRQNTDRIGTVLLDWNIPDSDPVSTLQELRGVSPTVRVIVVSGDRSLQSRDVRAQGFSRLLQKPISTEELVDAVA